MVKRSAEEICSYHQAQAAKAKLKIRISEYKAAHGHNIVLLRLRGQLRAAATNLDGRLPGLEVKLRGAAEAILEALETSMISATGPYVGDIIDNMNGDENAT